MKYLIIIIYLLCIHILAAQNIEDEMQATIPSRDERNINNAETNYNSYKNIINSQNAEFDSENNKNNLDNNNHELNNNDNIESSYTIKGDNNEKTVDRDIQDKENIENNGNGIKKEGSDSNEELNSDSSPSTYQVIEETLSSLAASMFPKQVVEALKSSEVNLLFHAILNTLFIIFVFIFSFKVFFGGATQFDISAMNDTLSKLQLDSAKMEQEKSEISSQIKEVLSKVKSEEKDGVKNEKEEAVKKLTSLKKDRESIGNTLSFLEEEMALKDGKLKAHVDKAERVCQKNKSLESELVEVKEKIKSMEGDIKTKSKELKEIGEGEDRLKKEVQGLQQNLTDLQDKEEKATSDVSALMKRAYELENENSLLQDQETTNKVDLQKMELERNNLEECLDSFKSIESQSENNSDDKSHSNKLKEYISTDVVELKLSKEGREVETAVKAIRNEEDMIKTVKVKADDMQADLDVRKEARKQARQASDGAAIKMRALSEYFKEKEKELNTRLKELDVKQGESGDGNETNEDKIARLNKMSAQYKSQVEDLQREIQEVESNYRKEVTSLERKSHDNWLSYRQTERETKDALAELNSLQAKILETQGKLDESNHRYMIENRIRPPFSIPPSLARLPMPSSMAGFPPRPPYFPFPPPSPSNLSMRLPPPSGLFDKNSFFVPVTAPQGRSPPFPPFHSSRPK